MMGSWWGGGMVMMMILSGLFWILLLAGVGYLLYWLTRHWQTANPTSAAHADDPLAVLKIRYARGEITREQYEEIRNDLQKHGVDHQ